MKRKTKHSEESQQLTNQTGILYLVPTPIGNLGDITLRSIETLKTVDLIAAEDTRHSFKLLAHYQITTKCISYHKFNERERQDFLLGLLQQGKNIAIISDAGTPGISDPSLIMIKAAIEQNIRVECLPGATAVIPAIVASGMDNSNFLFIGFLPYQKKARNQLLKKYVGLNIPIVVYEAASKISRTLSDIFDVFGERNIVICREISKLHEQYIRTSLHTFLKESNTVLKGEIVIVIEGHPVQNQLLANVQQAKDMAKQLYKRDMSIGDLISKLNLDYQLPRNKLYQIALETINEYKMDMPDE